MRLTQISIGFSFGLFVSVTLLGILHSKLYIDLQRGYVTPFKQLHDLGLSSFEVLDNTCLMWIDIICFCFRLFLG